jgi:hypothetical protein
MPSSTSDSASIASSKRSTKSSRRKRTIEGVHADKETNAPVAYTFCRTNSNVSSSTIATAPNVSESNSMDNESPYKRERTGEKSSNIFDEERFIHRNFSNTSTTSSASVGGFSFSSFDRSKCKSSNRSVLCQSILYLICVLTPLLLFSAHKNDGQLIKASPKRRKAEHLTIETGSNIKSIFKKKSGTGIDSSKFQQLTMNESSCSSKSGEDTNGNIFLSLSTSPINQTLMEETPVKTNTAKKAAKITIKTDGIEEETDSDNLASAKRPLHDHPADTPISMAIAVDTAMMTDEHMLNKHLRGQSFTPLPHLADSSAQSPSNAFASIGAQLSWSIAGDAPSLEDLANCSWEETEKDEKKRPGSTTSLLSNASRTLVISPHNFSLWKDDHESVHPKKGEDIKDSDIRISILSPHSEIAGGTTTPLPWSFETSEERENRCSGDNKSNQDLMRHNAFFSAHKPQATPGAYMWNGPAPPTPVFHGSQPPTPHFTGSYARSPLHLDRRDWFGHQTPGSHNDRVRNLRGRVPHGAHLAPMPLHIPPPMVSHHPLTSPMGIGHKTPMWSPHHGNMPPPMASPHPHMSMSPAVDMSQSKRKCLPLKPPIPSKFQGDMEKLKTANVPEFTSLVNFPAHMSQKQSVNLPEGMRCCVMCGQGCPCSGASKKKGGNNKKSDGMVSDNNFAIIPTQNKGLCTLCDVNVWVVVNSRLEIKWCKGCKNFRPWAAFGDKGLATKCLRCRERQREKYALQKEEKEKTRLLKGAIKAN